MIKVYTLNINNYFPEMMELTVPLMKNYAQKIGAEFVEITERKFPNYHIHYEKMQIYELGKDADWNIFFDGDVLVHPDMIDISKQDKNVVFIKDGYSASVKFLINKYFLNDKRNQGISSCFIATSNQCHNMWEQLEITPKELTNRIITLKDNLDIGITSEFYQEEYVLSYNLAKYLYTFSGISENSLFHSYKSNIKEEKLKEIKKVLKKWKLNFI
jgi:hypothetical protein